MTDFSAQEVTWINASLENRVRELELSRRCLTIPPLYPEGVRQYLDDVFGGAISILSAAVIPVPKEDR